MFKLLLAAVICVVLCGCETTTPEMRLAQNQTSCESYGFKAGTDAYAECMMRLDLNDQQRDRDRRRAIGEALSEMGRSMQANKPVTCNTYGSANRFGSSVYGNSTTTCY